LQTTEKIALMWERFVHRSDVYSKQWFEEGRGSGYYRVTEGSCPMKPPCPKKLCEHIKNVPLTDVAIYNHLMGDETLGIYQLGEDNTVKWLCIDVDIIKHAPEDMDQDELLRRVREQTNKLSMRCSGLIGPHDYLVERSGSKGYHLWVFFSEPVQARYAYALGEWIVSHVEPLVGIAVEVFPKQTALRSYGNLVKMPLGIHKKTGNRCFFVNRYFTALDDQWKALANVGTLTEKDVRGILESYSVQIPSSIRIEPTGDTHLGAFPCYARIMTEGLKDGARDVGTFRLSCYLRKSSLPVEAAWAALQVINNNNQPPLETDVLYAKLESAYSEDYSQFPCNDPLIDQYCSSKCRFFSGKLRERWIRYGKAPSDAVGKISRD
jgi:hypothetical protein